MNHDELKQIAELIGGLSSDLQDGIAGLRAEMNAGFSRIETRLDRMEARLERHAGLLQSGSRWVNRINLWSERVDRLLAADEKRASGLEDRIKKLENGHGKDAA